MTHPNARPRKHHPPLPSDITVAELRKILADYDGTERVPYFKVRVIKDYGWTQHESTLPEPAAR